MTDISPEAVEREYLEAIEIMGSDLSEFMLDEFEADLLKRAFILGQGDYPTGHSIIESTANELRKLRTRVAELEAVVEASEVSVAEAALIEEYATDTIEEIISETHDLDVTDRQYAVNVVGWLKRHQPAAFRALTGDTP